MSSFRLFANNQNEYKNVMSCYNNNEETNRNINYKYTTSGKPKSQSHEFNGNAKIHKFK